MLRIIITAIWIYVAYRLLTWAFKALGAGSSPSGIDRKSSSTDVNEMVKDPICGTYVLARDAKTLRAKGQTFYFCSDECRKRFLNN
ncbi:MAG: YHS domain-containing protein [Desulfomonilaceae bacterium]